MIAGLGRGCFRHRWWVLLGWMVVITAGVLASGPVFQALAATNNPAHVESIEAQDVLDEAAGSDGDVLGLVDRVDPLALGVRDAIDQAVRDLAARPDVSRVTSPYTTGPRPEAVPAMRSQDGRAVLVVVALQRLEQAERNTAVGAIGARLHQLAEELRATGQPVPHILNIINYGNEPGSAIQHTR